MLSVLPPLPLKKVLEMMDAHDRDGLPIPFNITFVTFNRQDRTGGQVTQLERVIRARYARNLHLSARREYVPSERREIAAKHLRSTVIRLYIPHSQKTRNCHKDFIVAFNGRTVSP